MQIDPKSLFPAVYLEFGNFLHHARIWMEQNENQPINIQWTDNLTY